MVAIASMKELSSSVCQSVAAIFVSQSSGASSWLSHISRSSSLVKVFNV